MEKYKAHINVYFLFHFIPEYISNNFNVLVSVFGVEYGTQVIFENLFSHRLSCE